MSGPELRTCAKCGMTAMAFICSEKGCPENGGAAYPWTPGPDTSPAVQGVTAEDAARTWLHAYGVMTDRYTAAGGDHPAMDTLPAAFEAYAAAQVRAGQDGEVVMLKAEMASTTEDRLNDLGRLLRALGFSDHARPISPAAVFDLCLREIEGLRQRIPDAEADALPLQVGFFVRVTVVEGQRAAALARATAAEEANERLRRRVADLEVGLRPFAYSAEGLGANRADLEPLHVFTRVRFLRRAAALLADPATDTAGAGEIEIRRQALEEAATVLDEMSRDYSLRTRGQWVSNEAHTAWHDGAFRIRALASAEGGPDDG